MSRSDEAWASSAIRVSLKVALNPNFRIKLARSAALTSRARFLSASFVSMSLMGDLTRRFFMELMIAVEWQWLTSHAWGYECKGLGELPEVVVIILSRTDSVVGMRTGTTTEWTTL